MTSPREAIEGLRRELDKACGDPHIRISTHKAIIAAIEALEETQRDGEELARLSRAVTDAIGRKRDMALRERDEARAIARRLRCDNDGEGELSDLAPLVAIIDSWPDDDEEVSS
jgi:hypothetical protein